MKLNAQPADTSKPNFFGHVVDVELSDAPLDAELRDAVIDIMDRFGVVVFRDQHLDDHQHVAFSRLFGELEIVPHFGVDDGKAVRMKLPELFDVSNLDENGTILEDNDRRRGFRASNEMWHTDSSFQPRGAAYSLLYSYVIPSTGADTEFADLRAAYDDLPDDLKTQIDSLVVEHSTAYSRSLTGYQFNEQELKRRNPTWQYLVQRDARGRKSLFMASHGSHVVGMDMAEGRALLKQLTDFATQKKYVHRHQWQIGDLLIWDNRCTMHRATPFNDTIEPRDLRRTTIRGDLPLVPDNFQDLSLEELLKRRDQRSRMTT